MWIKPLLGSSRVQHKRRVRKGCVEFMDLEIMYGRINRESISKILTTYDVGHKLLNSIGSILSLVCVRTKGVRV